MLLNAYTLKFAGFRSKDTEQRHGLSHFVKRFLEGLIWLKLLKLSIDSRHTGIEFGIESKSKLVLTFAWIYGVPRTEYNFKSNAHHLPDEKVGKWCCKERILRKNLLMFGTDRFPSTEHLTYQPFNSSVRRAAPIIGMRGDSDGSTITAYAVHLPTLRYHDATEVKM